MYSEFYPALNEFSWTYNPQYINFQLRKIANDPSLLLQMESQDISWSHFRITILLNDQVYRDNLFFG